MIEAVLVSCPALAMILAGYGDYLPYCTTKHARAGYLRWDVSHLCGHSHCVRPSHLVIELHCDNLARQDCEGKERCECGDTPGTPGFGNPCLGHRSCPDTCPERLRNLIDARDKLLEWVEFLNNGGDPKHPPDDLRCRETKTVPHVIRLQKALKKAADRARAAVKKAANAMKAHKRKADEEPVERIQKKAKAVTERRVPPRSKAAKEPASKAITATTRAQRRVSSKK